MTIAIAVKVMDGIVLAADSASTVMRPNAAGDPEIFNVYNNANKIANLRKGFPIGFVNWGAGGIGPASMSTLLKDLRRRFSGEDHDHLDWTIHRESYNL